MYEEQIIFEKTVPSRNAKYVNFPENLNPELIAFLKSRKIDKLYCHQAEMFVKSEEKNNLIITTSTASGKTLSFLLPVINRILNNPLTRAIFIYPTKALASDQYRAIKPFLDYFGQDRINAGVYDGDTPVNERARIRSNANIILTNPDMLNSAFLPNHSRYNNNFIFANLEFVVIDELHSYRGAFGSHMSNVFKRLDRICKYYNSNPQFLCSSATIANPIELATNICGKDFVLIDNDGSPAPEKNYKFIQPPFFNKTDFKVPVNELAKNIVPNLVLKNKHFIAFCKSRSAVEVILKESREQLKYDGLNNKFFADKIAGYRAGYTPEQRKEIENKMVNGELLGLVSTNALELGIDIGKIDTTLLVGFPNTRASFWQQSGRAGRNNTISTTYMILDDAPFDQYIAINPEWLFNSDSENAIIDKDNAYIQMAHIRSAAAELSLTLDDANTFSKLSEIVPILLKNNELRKENGKFVWCGGKYPAGDYSLRNIDPERYQIIDKKNDLSISEVDEFLAFRDCHDNCIYMHEGNMYLVEKLDLDLKKIFVVPTDVNYFTQTQVQHGVSILNKIKSDSFKNFKYFFGDVNVKTIISGHKKVQFNNHDNLGFEYINPNLEKSFDTESLWIEIPKHVSDFFHKNTPELSDNHDRIYKSNLDGMAFAIKNSAMMTTMASSEDISTAMGVDSNGISALLYIYDNYRGGLGYSKKIYTLIDRVVKNAIKMVSECKCKDGCAACIGDYHLDKKIVLWGLRNLIETSEETNSNKVVNIQFSEISKKFKLESLIDNWNEFIIILEKNGEYLSKFLKDINKAEIINNIIYLYVDNNFIKNWIGDINNIKQLKNIISYYVETPDNFDIVIKI